MTEKQVLELIEKCISKTKDNGLRWASLGDKSSLMRKSPPISNYAISSFPTDILDRSYYAEFNEGFLFLVPASSGVFEDLMNPSSGPKNLSLRVQPSVDSYYSEIANANDSDSNISIQLRRLYTIIENSGSDIDIFLNDFLNS